MGSTNDKIKGMANEAAGNVKQMVGKAVANKKILAEGQFQEVKGEAQQAVGEVKSTMKKANDLA